MVSLATTQGWRNSVAQLGRGLIDLPWTHQSLLYSTTYVPINMHTASPKLHQETTLQQFAVNRRICDDGSIIYNKTLSMEIRENKMMKREAVERKMENIIEIMRSTKKFIGSGDETKAE
uniref:39S ribosomal protein L52, mitochondrial n=1 Tax=Ascaris lumbricoides TaxID=6252 RepID=A0A0M3IMS2_ASCLU